MMKREYYLGLDIGTDSVGYAVTDKEYNLIKYSGEPAWGVQLFDKAALSQERRSFRTARRRLDRRQQRVLLIQELFAKEISKVDSRFYIRLKESQLYRTYSGDRYVLFNDDNYNDSDYYNEYPTIHHLIKELMESKEVHDVRLVYLACEWLVSHRGHFLSNIDVENLSNLKDFGGNYGEFMDYFKSNGYRLPWNEVCADELGKILKEKKSITAKKEQMITLLYGGTKPSKTALEDFPFSQEAIVALLSGGTSKVKDLFQNDSYEDAGSLNLGMDEDKFAPLMSELGEDYELIARLRSLFDWSVLVDTLGNEDSISSAKVRVYNQHRDDLILLKRFITKYIPAKYNEVFREINKDINNYVSYTYHVDGKDTAELHNKKADVENFSKYILSLFKNISPDKSDKAEWESMMGRLETKSFMPKQKNTANRVIPYQLYLYELKRILEKAKGYLPFLGERDKSGISVEEKIISVFNFRVPYFVGPLNAKSSNAWIVRKAGKIYPWNFNDMVDLDASEQNFIQRMTNQCTHIPGEPVLPKDSMLYHKFMVLNEINNIRINGTKLSVQEKQNLYTELFMNVKKVTRKKLINYLLSNGILEKGEEDSLSGIDEEIKSNLAPQIAFRQMIQSGLISEEDAENIIERSTYAEDKSRLYLWLVKYYPQLSDADKKYVCGLKFTDFGRLSKKFLCGIKGANKATGELYSIIDALWNTQDNESELRSDRYTFTEEMNRIKNEYYQEHTLCLDDRLDEMYLSNAVKRSVYRTLDIVNDVRKAFGEPTKIFVEMTRGGSEDQKGKRTKTRKQQILDLYAKCKNEDVKELKRQLESMGEYADNKLQGDKLFLYYMQLGKSMYSGKPIELEKLGSKLYDIDHIYPQAYVKDDSIINNKVLVLSTENGDKGDRYPIKSDIRHNMTDFWSFLRNSGMLSEEKYRRLTRSTPFSEDEKLNFINRQLTETSQSTKAVATLLKERYPEAEIVYCKARLTTDFRQEFGLFKSRLYNDLHHAVDAYLNIVTGNVYSMKFSQQWFNVNSTYSIKTKTLFTKPLICHGITVWGGEEMISKVKRTATRNTAHINKYSYLKHGGFFDQIIMPASEGLVPIKKGMDTEIFGGYNKSGIMFYIPVSYKCKKKQDTIILPIEMMYGDRFLVDNEFAREYAEKRIKKIISAEASFMAFPAGMRPWKINTMLSLDGFKVCLSGTGNGGKSLIAQSMVQFASNSFWQYYLKKLEMLQEKLKRYSNYDIDPDFDHISSEKNMELYDLYVEKLKNSIYKKRINAESPLEIMERGRLSFEKLDLGDQAKALINIHQIFGRIASGCDLSLIGGTKRAASTGNFSSVVSNWKKKYDDIRIIDSSASGLWESKSDNLLNLL